MSFKSIFNWLYGATLDRAMSVKRGLLALMFLLFLGGWNSQAWAYWTTDKDGNAQADNVSIKGYVTNSGGIYYVIDESEEHSVFQTGDYYYYQLGPGSQIKFEACTQLAAAQNLKVSDGYTNVYDGYPGHFSWGHAKYDPYGPFDINTDSKSIRFYGSTAATLTRWFQNVKVTMASYCEPETTEVKFGSNTYLNTDEKTVKIYWSNTGTQTISKTGDTDRFTVSRTSIPSQAGYYGNTVVSITYKRDQVGDNHTMILTVNGKTITVTGTTTKGTPSIDCSQVSASGLTYGQKLSASTISGPDASYENGSYPGTYTWTRSDASSHTALGCTNYSVTFTPTNTNLNSVTCAAVQVPITKVAQTITWNPAQTYIVDADVQLNATTSGHDASVYYTSGDESIATIDGNWVRMHKAGDVVITAHADATCNYNAAPTVSKTFQFRNRPVVQWRLTGENDHIYSGDFLTDIAYATYGSNSFNMDYAYTSSPSGILIQTEEKNKLLVNKELTQEVTCTVTATFSGDATYCPVTDSHTYTIEPKATPEFWLNETINLPADPVQELHLLVGETATMRFVNTDESNGWFTYPTAPQYISYSHNSSAHTGTITATKYGDEVIQFHQTGTTTIFDHTRSIHVYVSKHTTTLTTGLDGIKCDVEDAVATEDAYSVNAPAEGEPAQNAVVITSSDENIIRFTDGMWRAKNAGTATLTIAQANNDYWTGDTITATITVQKKTPTITWNLENNYPWGAQVSEPVVSSNTELPFTVVSNHPEIANYVDGRIEVYNLTGDVTFTLTQEGNYKWKDASSNLSKTIQVYQPQNHVPFTITSDNKSDIVIAAENKATWDNNGYKMGDDRWILSHAPNSYIIIALTGIPDKLSFTKKCDKYLGQLPVDGDCLFEVYESITNGNWGNAIWSYNKEEESRDVTGIPLSGSTRYIKLRYYGTVYGHFNNIKITERKEIVAPASQAFGSGYIGNNPTERTVNVDWYNVKTCTVSLTGTNAAYFQIAEGSNTIASSIDNYGTANLIVRYLHEVAGDHTATLHIESEDGKTADITLTGTTNKAIQEIVWREDITPLPLDEPYSGAAYATSGLAVTLTAETPGILKIEGDRVTGIGVGTTRLIATQAGDTKWEAVNETKIVEVTNKHVQHIIWTDKLSNVKREDGQTVTKTLTAYSDADNTLPITYELDAAAAAFASVSGNTLTITGWGTGYITARQAGNDDYVAVSATHKLVSRDPAAGCRPLVLDVAEEKTLHTIDSEEFPLQGEPATIEFDAKCDDAAIWGLWVGQYYNGSWHEVEYIARGDINKNYRHYGPYVLNRNTTKVKIYTETGATLTRTFKDVEVTLAKYLELQENNMDFSAVEYGQVELQQFTVNYSNLTGALDVELQNPSDQFEVRTTTLGEDCGDYQKNAVVQIRCTGRTVGTENNVIVISNRDQRLEIPISANVIKTTQQITWSVVSPVNILTSNKVQLVATATSELPVIFTSADNSIAEPYQDGDGWWLNIKQSGDVVITATQAGNTYYESTTTSRTYSIAKATPTVQVCPTSSTILPATLATVPLYGGSVTVDMDGVDVLIEGSFDWLEPTTVIERINSGYTAVFTPVEDKLYNTVTCHVDIEILKTPQTITWDFTTTEMLCNADFTFDATASSGLNVRYTSSDPTIAYVDEANRLRIIKGGEVTITAHQDGNDTYAAAAVVNKTLIINRFTPEIVTLPTAQSMLIGRLLSDASLTGGRVELDGVVVEGSFAWKDGNTTVENEAGVFARTVIFTPANTNWYNTVSNEMNVVVEKYAPAVYPSLTGSTIIYGQPLSNATISGTIIARDEIKYPQEDVQGTYAWKRPDEIVNAGSPSYATVVFTPNNLDWYKTAEFNIPLTVSPAELQTATATSQIFYGQILSEATLTNTTYGVIDGGTALIEGTLAWDGSLDMMHYYDLGTHTLPVIFTPSDPNYKPIPVAGTATLTVTSGFVFNGTDNTNWEKSENWLDNNKPTDSDDKVVILSDVDITGDVEVEAMTIRDGVTVTIKDGATLTLGNDDSYFREQYGDVKVEQGGKLILNNGTLDVNNLYIASAIGGRNAATQEFVQASSSQVENIENVNVHADAYFDLALDPAGITTDGWYDFTVPFPVSAANGIYDQNDVQLATNDNYIIQTYNEARRAQGGKGWQNFSGIMTPGLCYTIATDNGRNVYRFKKHNGTTYTEPIEMNLSVSAGEAKFIGWNGLGNGLTTYANLQANGEITKIQLFDHTTNSYTTEDINACTFVIGSAFFVQAPNNEAKVSFQKPVSDENLTLRAPSRTGEEDKTEFKLAFTAENSESVDYLYVGATEESVNEYVIGRDLLKMGTPTSATIAQIWANAYGNKLSDIDQPLVNENAFFEVGLYAPKTGNYVLDIVDAPQDATLYLTHDGTVIWNLSESAYTLSLMKGTTANYGLQLVREARNTATGVEQVGSETQIQKFIHNGVLYINKDGVLYDAMGKKVK